MLNEGYGVLGMAVLGVGAESGDVSDEWMVCSGWGCTPLTPRPEASSGCQWSSQCASYSPCMKSTPF